MPPQVGILIRHYSLLTVHRSSRRESTKERRPGRNSRGSLASASAASAAAGFGTEEIKWWIQSRLRHRRVGVDLVPGGPEGAPPGGPEGAVGGPRRRWWPPPPPPGSLAASRTRLPGRASSRSSRRRRPRREGEGSRRPFSTRMMIPIRCNSGRGDKLCPAVS